MKNSAWLVMVSALAITAAADDAAAQALATRINGTRDGSVQMTFATRPGVCGDGHGSVTMRNGDGYGFDGRGYRCIAGPMVVTIGRADGQTVSIRECVACRPATGSEAVSLGEVPPVDAAKYLLSIARTLGGRNADYAITAAALADADNLGPQFAELIRDENATLQSRKQALFWMGQTTESSRDLIALDGTLKSSGLREQYTFVLSQRRDDPSLDKLMDIARGDPDMEIRKRALFWLGQSHDPKALQFFKDILRR